MNNFTCTFISEEHLPSIGDYEEMIFIFSIIDSKLIETLDKSPTSIETRIFVKISGSLQTLWKLLSQKDLNKVMYAFAKRQLEKELAKGKISEQDFHVDLNTSTAPRICPYPPDEVDNSMGQSFTVNYSRPIGFIG